MKNILPCFFLAVAASLFLTACGKEEPNDLSQLNRLATADKNVVEDARAKAVIAADKGKKVQYVCRVVNQFPSKSNEDTLPVSVPALGITHKGDRMLGIVASTPEIAREIVGLAGALLIWEVVTDTCTVAG